MDNTAPVVVGRHGSKVNVLPPREFLEECFSYNPETGDLTWKERPLWHFVDEVAMRKWNTRNAGKLVRSRAPRGHLTCSILHNGEQIKFLAHRIVFAMNDISIPDGMIIDHINGIPSDNRMCNLRICTNQQNCFNSVTKPRTRNNGLPRGVYPANQSFGYVAKIRHNYKEICLGTFSTPEEASFAYVSKAKELRGEFLKVDDLK